MAVPYAVLLLTVLSSALMPGTVIAIAGTTLYLVQGGSDLTVGLPGLSGFIAMAIFIAMIWFYDRKHDRIMKKGIIVKDS